MITNKVTGLHKKVDPICGVRLKVELVSLWGWALLLMWRLGYRLLRKFGSVFLRGHHGSCFRHGDRWSRIKCDARDTA
jgi:hypothetical protein